MNQEQLKKELEVDEGKRARIYPDTKGKITGGVGRNLTDRAFSEDEIQLMLNNDVRDTLDDLKRGFPWYVQMTDARQRVYANMCFNLGLSKFLRFQKMHEAARNGQYEIAAKEMLNSKWATDVGDRAVRLAAMMKKGD